MFFSNATREHFDSVVRALASSPLLHMSVKLELAQLATQIMTPQAPLDRKSLPSTLSALPALLDIVRSNVCRDYPVSLSAPPSGLQNRLGFTDVVAAAVPLACQVVKIFVLDMVISAVERMNTRTAKPLHEWDTLDTQGLMADVSMACSRRCKRNRCPGLGRDLPRDWLRVCCCVDRRRPRSHCFRGRD